MYPTPRSVGIDQDNVGIKEKPDLIGSKLFSKQCIYLLMLFPNMISK